MNSEGFEYFIYDKYCNDHMYNNPKTCTLSLDDIMMDTRATEIYDLEAARESNKLKGSTKIPENLPEMFKIIMYVCGDIKCTVIGINIDKACNIIQENITNKTIHKEIIDFIMVVCRFHILYERTRKLDGTVLNTADMNKKLSDQIINKVTASTGTISDPVMEHPKFINCKLYPYQIRSIKWMLDREINSQPIVINEFNKIYFGKYYYDLLHQRFTETKIANSITFKGGALIDEVGLGKTIQMLTLSLLNAPKRKEIIKKEGMLTSRATLIICPNQLCGQWQREIDKMISEHMDLKVVMLLTKVHYDKLSYKDLTNADFVIVSSAFLENKCFVNNLIMGISTNKNYLKSSEFNADAILDLNIQQTKEVYENKKIDDVVNPNIFAIHWHRIIIDEFHETYSVEKHMHVDNLIPLMKSMYKWAVTGTPFDKTSIGINKMIRFVGANTVLFEKILMSDNVIEHLTTNFFRKNTKESIKLEFSLKPLKETIIWLKFSPTERLMYNAYLANPQINKFDKLLRQLCCHPQISDELKSSLTKCKTLEDIEKTMLGHYRKDAQKAENKMIRSKLKLEIYNVNIKRYEIRRQRYMLRSLGYRVHIDYLPELDEEKIKQITGCDDPDDIVINFNDDLEDDDEDNEKQKNKVYPKGDIHITEKNESHILKIIGNQWNQNRITYDSMFDTQKKIEDKIKADKNIYEGKRISYEFYKNLMDRIKSKIEKAKDKERHKLELLENGESESDSDSNSDSDDDDNENCGICLGVIPDDNMGVTKCGHMYCFDCIKELIKKRPECPYCKMSIKPENISLISFEKLDKSNNDKAVVNKNEMINRIGTKMANLILYLKSIKDHVIIFSQWDDLLRRIGDALTEHGIKNLFCRGNVWQRNKTLKTFNEDDSYRVIMLSSESTASGSNLTKASKVILVDPIYGTDEFRRNTEWQAIGRAYRMGQVNQVEVVRLIVKDTVEQEIYEMNTKSSVLDKYVGCKVDAFDDTINANEKEFTEMKEISECVKKDKQAKIKVRAKTKKVVVNEVDYDSD